MSCILCDTYFSKDCPQFEIYYTTTSHSNTLLINFIKKILNWDLNEDSHSRYLCQPCYNIFQELDYAELTCSRLRKQLSERSISNRYNNLVKDSCTQTTDESEDKYDDFSETLLESLKTESNITKSPVPSPEPEPDLEINEEPESKTVIQKKNKPYECNFCSKKFSSKTGLSLHKQRQHQNEQNSKETPSNTQENSIKLECDVVIEECLKTESEHSDAQDLDESFSPSSTRTRLKRGKKKSSKPIKPLKYSCPQCPKMWRTLGELRSHVATHSNLRPYICEVCGQAYKHKQALDIHVGMHNGINPFSCHYCHKAFTQKGALQRHLPIHTGEAPYQCDLCGKRFVHHTSFNMHTLAHTGQKSYKCNICGLALLSGSHLKRHMRVHTGERPYACAQCGKRFAERYNLAAHQRLHEAGPSELSRRLHRCQVCGAGFDRRPKLEEHLSNNHNKIQENDQTRKWVGHFLSNT